jgi:CheY-like chemotaxis protein
MSPDTIERAFEPFFTTKGPGKGTGLGLSMVYGFVKQSGGHVKIYSEPGRRTSVKVYLPLGYRAGPAEDRPTATPPTPVGSETILVVEDEELVRRTAVAQLAMLGYRVTEAPDGASAVEILKGQQAFDLLFTDVVLPGGMMGSELAELARSIRPSLRVLFTSGYTENAIVHQGTLDSGVQLLTKPYTKDALARKIRSVLDGQA